VALAGEIKTWKFIYTTATKLPKGTKLKFDLESKGRDIDWQVPTANLKKNSNVIFIKLQNGKVVAGKEIENRDSFTPLFEFVLPSEVDVGDFFFHCRGFPQRGSSDSKQIWNQGTNQYSKAPFIFIGYRHFRQRAV